MTDGIVALLKASQACLLGLARWQGYPAVFSVYPPPMGCGAPYAMVVGQNGESSGTRGQRAYDTTAEVTLWGRSGEGPESPTLAVLADAIHQVLDRSTITVDGYDPIHAICSNPSKHSDAVYPGYRMTVSAVMRKTI